MPVVAIALLGVLSTGIAKAIHVALMERAGPSRGAIAGYTIHIVALLLGVLVRNETVEPIQVFAVGVAATSAWLVSRREKN